MPLSNGELARRTESGVEIRPEPVRLRWKIDEILSADGHNLHASFLCGVRALPDASERQMLAEAFMNGSPAVTFDSVAGRFQGAFQKALVESCRGRTASDLTSAVGTVSIIEAIKTAGNRLAFTCGLELVAPFELDLASPSLEQQRAKELQQTLLKQQQEGQLKEFRRAAELIRQFNEIRKSAPELSAGEVLRRLSPDDQGLVLQTLLAASGQERRTSAVWAVAGSSLLRIDPRQSSPSAAIVPVPTSLGPLRSVQPAQSGAELLLGARSGVVHVDPDKATDARCYSDPQVSSQLGFSRALMWNGEIWACHSDAGILAWKIGQPEGPAFALRKEELGGAAPRNLEIVDDSQLIFSAERRLAALSRIGREGSGAIASPVAECPAEIVAILPEARWLVVVLADGTVQLRNRKSPEVLIRSDRRCAQACAAALLPWLGSSRLLLASEEGAVLGIGLDDELVTQYLSPYRGMKALAAAADLIAGLAPDRQRVVLWRSWEMRQPAADVFIAGVARHRAADVSM